MQYSDGYLNSMHLKHTSYFDRRTPREELCAQMSSLRKKMCDKYMYEKYPC